MTDQFNFIDFDNILIQIRNSFITEIDSLGLLQELRLNGRIYRKLLKHCTLEEVLKSFKSIKVGKINVIIVKLNGMSVTTGSLFDSNVFCKLVIDILNSCKRKIPILIKMYSGVEDFNEFIRSGEGHQYLMSILGDRERLRLETSSFREFRTFAKRHQLKYIVENVLGDVNFKKLFIS